YHATSVQSSRSRRAGFWLLHLCRVAFAADAELEREERSHSHRLFWLNANRWNDLRPMVDLADEEAGEFHRRAAQWVQALKLHFGDNVRHLQRRHRRCIELVDDRRRRSCGRQQAVPADVDDAGNGLVDRGSRVFSAAAMTRIPPACACGRATGSVLNPTLTLPASRSCIASAPPR